ncbi:hypothetical protein [Kocuria sp. ZOR0020]|uniref:hypothetical protein n=1 Tax=Kocuria sp. ZOR0020 TaxID=1339234 RepID=UPI00064785EB|nr:hypothetical protein [Kocuria sp. ZOR0020]
MAETATVVSVVMAALLGVASVAVLVVAAFKHPKVTAGLLVVLIMLSQTIQTVTGIPALGYGDELGVILALLLFTGRRLYVHGSVRAYPALWFFLAFAVLGSISSVVNTVPMGVMATGAFLFLKGPILGFAVAQLDWTKRDLPNVARFGACVVGFVLAITAINAVAPAAWNSVIGRVASVSERGGFSSLTGPFDHPVGLGTTMSMAFLAILLYRQLVAKGPVSLVLLIGSGLACIAAFRRKSIAAGIITALAVRAVLPGPKAMYFAAVAILLPVALVLGREPLTQVVTGTVDEYTANVAETARVLMTLEGLALALASFPLGVGFGRYASFTASENYSPLYEDRGYQWIYGMGRGDMGGFLSDTFWPAPLAETGILGGLCYAAALFLLVVPAWRMMRRAPERHVRWAGAVTLAWMLTLTIESVVAPVFVSPPMFGLPFVAAGVCTSLTARESVMESPAKHHDDAHSAAGGSIDSAEATPHVPWAAGGVSRA